MKLTNYVPEHSDLLAGGGLTLGSGVGGDLGGDLPIPTVTGLQGIPISPTPPTDGQVYVYDAGLNEWVPGQDAGVMVPVFIPSGTTFTVPSFKQALYAMTIDNEGILIVDGYLVGVD